MCDTQGTKIRNRGMRGVVMLASVKMGINY